MAEYEYNGLAGTQFKNPFAYGYEDNTTSVIPEYMKSENSVVTSNPSIFNNNQVPQTTPTFMDSIGGLQGVGLGIEGLSAIGNYFNASKANKLAEKGLAFNMDMANKQYAMAKDAYDKNVARAKSVGDQMNAGKVE